MKAGLLWENTELAVSRVVEVAKQEKGPALTPLLLMVVLNVRDPPKSLHPAIKTCGKL